MKINYLYKNSKTCDARELMTQKHILYVVPIVPMKTSTGLFVDPTQQMTSWAELRALLTVLTVN